MRFSNFFLVAILAAVAFPVDSGAAPVPGVFVLERQDGRIVLNYVPVPAGEVVAIPAGPSSGVIGVVFPPGPGTSSGLEQTGQDRVIIARSDGDRIHCEIRVGGRSASGYPDRSIAELAAFDTRVSVIGGDGTRAAFLIRGYADGAADGGPIQNLFAGTAIPLGPGDYIVTTDTDEGTTGPAVTGTAPIELTGHAFVRVTGPGNRAGWFLLDTGAAETVVAKSFLADTAQVVAASVSEYSGAGRRLLDYAPGGATGNVQGVLGHTVLPELRCGSIRFAGVEAAVLPAIPDFLDRPVAGIIGLDLLRRAGTATLSYPAGARGTGTLTLGPADPGTNPAAVPFARVSGHVVFPARVEGTEVFMILDSGAPGVVLDSAAAVAAGLTATANATLKGLDGRGTRAAIAQLDSIGIGDQVMTGIGCRIGALHAFRTLRDRQSLALLGNEAIARFEQTTIDFDARTIRFAGPRGRP